MWGYRSAASLFVFVAMLLAWAGPAGAIVPTPGWANAYFGEGNAVNATVGDADGNIYIAGLMNSSTLTLDTISLTGIPGGSNLLFAKFRTNGEVIWAKNFGGNAGTTYANAIAVDIGGNIYATGFFSGSGNLDVGNGVPPLAPLAGNSPTMFVVKLNAADGLAVWVKAYGAPGTSTTGKAVAVDPSGSPVFMGEFSGGDIMVDAIQVSLGPTTPVNGRSNKSAVIAKVDRTTGTASWAISSTGANASASVGALGADNAGNIYASGYFSGGNMIVGGQTMTKVGSSNLWLAALDSSGAPIWAKSYGGTGVNADASGSNLAVDGDGNSYIAGNYTGGALDFGTTPPLAEVGADFVVAKISPTGNTIWARNWGTVSGINKAYSIARDSSGEIYFTATSLTASLTIGNTVLPRRGSQSVADMVIARLDASGNATWAARYGGVGATINPTALATTGISNLIAGGRFYAGSFDIETFPLANSGSSGTTMFLANFVLGQPLVMTIAGTGTVSSTPAEMACSATCVGRFTTGTPVTLTATPGSGHTFTSWGGDCNSTSATASVTMNGAQNCTATFTADPIPPTPTPPTPTPTPSPMPPEPTPAFVSTSNPPPAVITADTTGSGQGTVSFASSFANPSSLSFTATQTSGAALPAWLAFDPATVSFNYNVPLPADLPIQPSADPAERAARSTVNTVYPLSVLVQTIPVNLTATGNGQSYTAAITMDFYAPRAPVAMTAVSYSANGISGNAASGRPALSWDGGQVVFETQASNINPATGGYSSIARYHGLSGKRDLLSQTAIPGGGVANGAAGNSNNPAVSASGSHAAFSSVAPGLSATTNNRLRQVYRTGLAFPRLALNEAATPAAIMISSTAAGLAADAAADMPAISEQGTFVAFESAAGNLGRNPDRLSQIWRKDAGSGAIVLVSSAADGTPGNGDSRNVALSWDGNFAVFESAATNLAPGGLAGRQIYLKNIAGGQVYRLGAGSNPRIDARATSVVYVSALGTKSQVMRYDILSGATTIVSVTPAGVGGNGDSTQAALSADGRFVVFRSAATDLAAGHAGNGKSQIWIRDVMRGATALVTQTEAGAPGGGDSSDPALSGDGSTVGFTTQARDLVNGTPLPGQIHLAANPLVLPGRVAYWYAPEGGNLAWSVERWGDKALVAGLLYGPDGGTAMWVAGNCTFTGLTCQGTVSQWSNQGTWATAVGPVTMTFAADGRSATVTQGGAAARNLAPYPVGGGARTTGYAGLPQSGYWGTAGNAAGVSSLFIDTDTQVGANGTVTQNSHMTLFGYDAGGNPEWYAALGPITADRTFAGQLFLHAGGSSWSQGTGTVVPSTTQVGTLRVNFTASDRATVQLPDGRIVEIQRWRF